MAYPSALLMDPSPLALLHEMLAQPSRMPPMPEHTSLSLQHLMRQCFQWEPEARPTASALLESPFLLEHDDEVCRTIFIRLSVLLHGRRTRYLSVCIRDGCLFVCACAVNRECVRTPHLPLSDTKAIL